MNKILFVVEEAQEGMLDARVLGESPNANTLPNGHAQYATSDDETRHAHFPLSISISEGGRSKVSLCGFHVSEHQHTIPLHDPLRPGTHAAILVDVAAHHEITRDALRTRLFG